MTNKPATGFDFATLERKTYELELVHPGTGRGLGLFLSLTSVNEPEPKKVTARVQVEGAKLNRKNGSFTPEQQKENAIKILTACTTGWRWGVDADGLPSGWNGEQLEFTPDNLRRIMLIDEMRGQIDEAVADNANFFRK